MNDRKSPLRFGSPVRVTGSSNLEGCTGTVIDTGGGLPDLPDMIRVRLPDQVPPVWWINADHLVAATEPQS
jgi:hypothetical protein